MKTISLLLAFSLPLALRAASAVLSVDADQALHPVYPGRVLGLNSSIVNDAFRYTDNSAKFAATGSRRFRYPGGALSDAFHWNSAGSYVNDVWVSQSGSW